MNTPLKQHLIDPEICIRCYTCEMTCPLGAIEHDDNNVVVNAELCNFCMDCIPVCPTGSIDEWRVVASPYSLEAQYEWEELPEQEDLAVAVDPAAEQTEEQDPIAALLSEAQKGAGGRAVAPISAAKPTVNLYNLGHPVEAVVQGNYPLTEDPEHDVHHIILDFQGRPFPVLEGAIFGHTCPRRRFRGQGAFAASIFRFEPAGWGATRISQCVFDCETRGTGASVRITSVICSLVTGSMSPARFGASFLLPLDQEARLLMICTGTGSAPMRAFTMARQRRIGPKDGGMVMFFGARTPESLPYFGPLNKLPEAVLQKISEL
jgi:benzoyl-CoA 2,3-dioxygenase component A